MDIGCFCLCMIYYHIKSLCFGCNTKLLTLPYAIMMWHLSIFIFSSMSLLVMAATGLVNKKCKCK